MEIEPFKIREEMKGKVLLEAAKEYFGEPHQRSVSGNYYAGPLKTVMNWVVMDNFSRHSITIGYEDGRDSIDFNWETESFSSGNAVCVNLKTHNPAWTKKVWDFIEAVKKPWDSWTEDELLQDPMWIYLFWRANGSIPESLHNAMVLSGDNEYVKRYFQEWQGSPPRSSPG
jgi:hypothetical protein